MKSPPRTTKPFRTFSRRGWTDAPVLRGGYLVPGQLERLLPAPAGLARDAVRATVSPEPPSRNAARSGMSSAEGSGAVATSILGTLAWLCLLGLCGRPLQPVDPPPSGREIEVLACSARSLNRNSSQNSIERQEPNRFLSGRDVDALGQVSTLKNDGLLPGLHIE